MGQIVQGRAGVRIEEAEEEGEMSTDPEYSISDGNVFEDLGLPDSDELLAKGKLASQIVSILQHRHITQADAAALLGVSQPRVSDLMRRRLDRFSLVCLMEFLVALDRDVEIVVRRKPRSRERARLRVQA
jgi:predicted XRE-type DNA-binding protein